MADKVKLVICDDNEPVRVTLTRALKFRQRLQVVGDARLIEDVQNAT